jgi:tRNA(Ile)-lysidine synthase
MAFSPEQLRAHLSLLPTEHGGLCVAFSGGLDSTVLLHALTRLAAESPRFAVRAIHVDHGLHPESARWREHCEHEARALGVDLVAARVHVDVSAGAGLEAAARDARYGALRGGLGEAEILLTAHHADDQLETILLALMRGAGVRGLSAMPALQRFGRGWLVRPLLEYTRSELEHWARAERLSWLDDPSNDDRNLDRNYLRHTVLADLRQRWPAAARSATRSAAHAAEAAALLDDLAALDLQALIVGPCLSVEGLRQLASARRRNVLRHWLRARGAQPPSARKLAAIEHDMLGARADSLPCFEWEGARLRRHRGLLYCDSSRPLALANVSIPWDGREALPLPGDLGRLRLVRDAGGGLAESALSGGVEVRFRAGGESLRPAGDPHHRPLKKLLQRHGVLPWWRNCLPLLYTGERLLAVGDLWIAEEFSARAGEPGVALLWDDRPRLTAPTASDA